MEQRQIIYLIGNIASGKTTAINILKDKFSAEFIMADNLFQTRNPFRDLYLKDIKKWAFTNETWLTIERARLINEVVDKSRKRVIFIDSGLLMSWVYTYSHYLVGNFSKQEWQLYQDIFQLCTKDIFQQLKVIYFKCKPLTLKERIKQRGRDYELKFYTETYINQIELGLKAMLKELKHQTIPTLVLKEKEISDFQNRLVTNKRFLKLVKQFITN